MIQFFHIHDLLSIITRHPTMAYGFIVLTALSESLALIGLIIPGTVIMFGIGAVVSTGTLDLRTVLYMAASGAVAGDGISYWLGHHYKEHLRRFWPFSRYPGMLGKGEQFFNHHGGTSILFGRFIGPVRPVIPVVAGMLGMRPLYFSVVNVLSAIGWALVYILPGVFLGTSLSVAGAVSTRLGMLIFILFAAVWGFVWIGRRLVLWLACKGPGWFAGFKRWVLSDKPVHLLLYPVRKLFYYPFFHQQGEELFFVFLVLLFFLSGWGALSILQDILAKDPLIMADQAVYYFFQSFRTPWGDPVFIGLSELGGSFVNICLFFSVLIVLVSRQCYRTARFWTITILGALAGLQFLHWLSLRNFSTPIHNALSFGFLSGQTAISVIMYGFLAVMFARSSIKSILWGRIMIVLLIPFMVAFSRLYLGTHWLSDILGGIFAGTGWTALAGIAWVKKSTKEIPGRMLGFAIILSIGLACGWQVTWNFKKDLVSYTPRFNEKTLTFSDWSGNSWKDLPAWRFDMGGEREQPLTLQWAGSTETLALQLLNRGWHRSASVGFKSLLGMFSPDTPIEKLPVFPHLHSGRIDCLRFVYPDKENQWVLRLWPLNIRIRRGNIPLFSGTIEIQHRRHLPGFITIAMDTGEYDQPLIEFKDMLKNHLIIKSVSRSGEIIRVNYDHSKIHWNGSVLLIWANNNQMLKNHIIDKITRPFTMRHH